MPLFEAYGRAIQVSFYVSDDADSASVDWMKRRKNVVCLQSDWSDQKTACIETGGFAQLSRRVRFLADICAGSTILLRYCDRVCR